VRWESLLIAGLGTAAGLALAVGGAWGMVRALDESEGIAEVVVPGGQLAVIAALAALAAVLAATGPARRAARIDVLAALAAD
jgi:putative ABC transport system permease protein